LAVIESQGSLPFDVADVSDPQECLKFHSTNGATPLTPESRDPLALPALPADPAFVFVRHPRARRYLLHVRNDGSVRVTIPRGGSKREAVAFAEAEQGWIRKQRERLGRACHESYPPLEPCAERALRERAKVELPRRLQELAAEHHLSVKRVSVRDQRSRWGSCSARGVICLNWRLVMMPESVRDYVLIHELMHLKRLDHSPKFWKLVERACPGYREARRWLRTWRRPVAGSRPGAPDAVRRVGVEAGAADAVRRVGVEAGIEHAVFA
jgi:predicted metal-dependent hydrolase